MHVLAPRNGTRPKKAIETAPPELAENELASTYLPLVLLIFVLVQRRGNYGCMKRGMEGHPVLDRVLLCHCLRVPPGECSLEWTAQLRPESWNWQLKSDELAGTT